VAEELFADRYLLLEPLGRGAMSAVWLAEDTELGRRVAVKTLGPTADRERFTREARAVAALSHPNICALYDYGETGGRPYMVLEHLPDGSLEDRLAAGRPLADADTQRIAAEIAAGLAHAHDRGLVHRDLKPANILFDGEGRAKIADFGIARMGGTGTLTEAGTVLGTASYISPEQASGEPAGPASDVYSFGVVLFRMLTGRLPFSGRNAMDVVRMHRDDPPPAVTDVRADAPPALAALADHALAKQPGARPADGAALVAALRGETDATRTLLAAPPVIAETEATRVLPAVSARSRARRGLIAAAAAPRRRRRPRLRAHPPRKERHTANHRAGPHAADDLHRAHDDGAGDDGRGDLDGRADDDRTRDDHDGTAHDDRAGDDHCAHHHCAGDDGRARDDHDGADHDDRGADHQRRADDHDRARDDDRRDDDEPVAATASSSSSWMAAGRPSSWSRAAPAA
jgi:hypothetical protein